MKSEPMQGFVQVGRSTPGGPGDIFVSKTAIAQVGMAKVRELVRDIYRAAYAAPQRKDKTP